MTHVEDNALTADQLTLGYGERTVINALSLDFPAGQMTAILGPNGCGKSTLLRALARLIVPAAGKVRLGGEDVFAMDTRALARQLAILPQSSKAPEGITVGDLVRRGRTPWRGLFSPWSEADAAAVSGALNEVGLADLSDRPIDQLSGGQRQRAWIALVLAQNTSCLLLDEPTTWLDLAHQIEVLSLIRKRNRDQAVTVVTVLHDLNLAARFYDRLVLLGPNGMVAAGSPQDVLTQENLATAFGLAALVMPDPVTGTPMVVPR
ncbi:ABC transporter ATP-binding protein [Neorhizobium sp. NPDC001467]|uniref:ABC transporter ATP-binding protein n=1 Tax=Neorhizobium sp. NPDC001467 TaxID=3390595 RepID=UPI003D087F2A